MSPDVDATDARTTPQGVVAAPAVAPGPPPTAAVTGPASGAGATPTGPPPEAPEPPARAALAGALRRLRAALGGCALPLAGPGAADADRLRLALLGQLDDYVLPRLARIDAPLLAVVGGSTGAGKSTLVNSLLGRAVSATGVLRPTTRAPILVHHPGEARWFGAERILPGLPRTTGPVAIGGLHLVADAAVPAGLALLDAPDIDSVVEANRELATQLLAAADLWLFVTSAARYADAVPWDFLTAAAERSTAVAVVLDRVPVEAIRDVAADLRSMLVQAGLRRAPLLIVPESKRDAAGLLPADAVAGVRGWLTDLAGDAARTAAVVRQTLDGAIGNLAAQAPAVAAAAEQQLAAGRRLADDATRAYAVAVDDVESATRDGTMLRGEVLARWQEFVGTGELLRSLQTHVGHLRDRIVAALSGRPDPARGLDEAVETGLQSVLRAAADAAAERTVAAWRAQPAGRMLLAGDATVLAHASADFPDRAGAAVRAWQGEVLDLVAREGRGKRTTARFLSFGINGLGLALMVFVFAQTAGLSGAEIGIAGGTTVIGQRLLEAVFGDQAVRELAKQARGKLRDRTAELMGAERARFAGRLDRLTVDPQAAGALRAAAADVARARAAGLAAVGPGRPGGVSDPAGGAVGSGGAEATATARPRTPLEHPR